MTGMIEKVLRPFLFVFFKIFLKLPGHRKIMRPFANRFIGGETLDEAIEKGKELAARGFSLTFAYVGEESRDVNAAREAELAYISLIDRINEEKEKDRQQEKEEINRSCLALKKGGVC